MRLAYAQADPRLCWSHKKLEISCRGSFSNAMHAFIYVHACITVRLFGCFYISVLCSVYHMADWPSSLKYCLNK